MIKCNACKKQYETYDNFNKRSNGNYYKICNICKDKYYSSKLETVTDEIKPNLEIIKPKSECAENDITNKMKEIMNNIQPTKNIIVEKQIEQIDYYNFDDNNFYFYLLTAGIVLSGYFISKLDLKSSNNHKYFGGSKIDLYK
jgi:hypothetical protein